MTTFLTASLAALWLGILTSLSPCPLATNIAATSFVSRRAGRPKEVFLSGVLYTAGRTASYLVIGVLVVAGVLAIPGVAFALQRTMNMILGPVLIVAGVLILGVVPLPSFGSGALSRISAKADHWGWAGSFGLGALFALSFCPVSAGLFFGSLIPLAIAQNSKVALPVLYGIGTALPVLLVAVVLAFSVRSLGTVFQKLSQIEKWARRITSAIFILVGLYYTVMYTFN